MVKKELEFLKEIEYSPDTIKKYTYLFGDFHKIIFSHEKKSKEIILKIIKNYPGIKWKIIRLLILLNLHTFLKKGRLIGNLKLKVDSSQNYPGEVILIDQRKKIFDLKNKKIYYILKKKAEILKETKIRKKYPKINFAPLLKSPRNKNVVAIKFLDFVGFNQIENIPKEILVDVFNQLIYFYKKNKIKKETFSREISKIFKRNNNFRSFKGKNKKIMDLAYQVLNKEKELILVQSHGDLHLAHIGKDKEEGKIYILDWENSREENLLFDFFWMTLVDYKINKKNHINYIINKTYLSYILSKFEKDFKINLDRQAILMYLALTLIKIIESAYHDGKLKEMDLEFNLLNKAIIFIRRFN